MKLKYDFAVREIAGEYVLIPMGGAALAFSGMVSTNAVGACICECLKSDTTPEAILDAVCAEFDIEEETARQDMLQFLQELRRAGLLQE